MNTLSKIKNFNKLIEKASKELKLIKVFHNDTNFEKTKIYLQNQKFLSNTSLANLINANNFKEYPIGYIMKNTQDEIVGFMGTFFSDRLINNKKILFCNIHSWIVNLNYRLYAFYLIANLLKTNVNLTAYTPVKSLKGLLKKMGFKKEIINFKIYLNANLMSFKKPNYDFYDEKKFLFENLKDENKKLFEILDNEIYKKILLINKKNNKKIFIVGSFIKKKNINFFNLFYISDTLEFKNGWKNIKDILTKNLKIRFFSEYFIDENLSIKLDTVFSKKIKKEIFIKSDFPLSYYEFLSSDLIIS